MGASILSGIFLNGWAVARTRDDSSQQFTKLVTNTAPPGMVVETMEWEISFLSDRTFHRPPVELIVDGTKVVFLGAPPNAVDWYTAPPPASYLVAGPMSKWIGAYKSQIKRGDYAIVDSVGDYDLYRRTN